jgi:hypothetical protein
MEATVSMTVEAMMRMYKFLNPKMAKTPKTMNNQLKTNKP